MLVDADKYLSATSLQTYIKIYEQLEPLHKYEAPELLHYRVYIGQISYYKSWHFAVEYLQGLLAKHPRAEFKVRLGEALCQPIIGRSSEGIALLREAMTELEAKETTQKYFQQTALILLEVLYTQRGTKEFKRNYERLEPKLRGYPPFEERRAGWEM